MTELDELIQDTRDLRDDALVRIEVQCGDMGQALTITLEELRELAIPKRKPRDKDEARPDSFGCWLFIVASLIFGYFGVRELLLIYVTSCGGQ